MITDIRMPTNFDRLPLAERLRLFAHACRGSDHRDLPIVADLEEAATELELGQRTRLTFRGGKAR